MRSVLTVCMLSVAGAAFVLACGGDEDGASNDTAGVGADDTASAAGTTAATGDTTGTDTTGTSTTGTTGTDGTSTGTTGTGTDTTSTGTTDTGTTDTGGTTDTTGTDTTGTTDDTTDTASGDTGTMDTTGTTDDSTAVDVGDDTTVDMADDTTMDMADDSTMDTADDTTMDMADDSTMDTADDTTMDMGGDTSGPPEGAYEACSGEPVPALTLTTVLQGLSNPIHGSSPSGDPSTMYIAQRGGALVRANLDDGSTTEIISVTTSTSAECGLLSVALHPNFDGAGENRIYLSYNPTCPAQIFGSGGSSTLEEYTVDGDSATLVRSLFQIDQPEGNHNGGSLAFGPDGYLYYGLGDGGGGNDQHGGNGNGQDVNVPLGSILRFDVDNPDTPPAGNLTSADAGGASVDGRIFHYGVRNPWRFSFDRATGDMYIGDVGQDTWEEVNFAPAGSGPLNFGWSAREGLEACPGCGGHSLLSGTTATDPIKAYGTPNPGGGGLFQGSVTGGFVYRGSAIPGLYGRYIYADYVRGTIYLLTYDGNGGVCDEVEDPIPGASIPAESLVSFAEDANGEIYIMNMARGSVHRVDPG